MPNSERLFEEHSTERPTSQVQESIIFFNVQLWNVSTFCFPDRVKCKIFQMTTIYVHQMPNVKNMFSKIIKNYWWKKSKIEKQKNPKN